MSGERAMKQGTQADEGQQGAPEAPAAVEADDLGLRPIADGEER